MTILLDIHMQVKSDFETCVVALTKDNPELQRFILFHERKELVIRQMCREIAGLEVKFGRRTVMDERRKIVAGVTEMFVKSAKLHKEQQSMSEIAKRGTQSGAHEEMRQILQEAGPLSAV